MPQLVIDDLGFLVGELSECDAIDGGAYARYSAIYTTSYSTDKDWGYIAHYSVDKSGYSYTIGGGVSGAVAGAIASAIAVNGVTIVSTGSSTGASV